MTRRARRQAGFSLVEIALALAVIGVTTLVLWRAVQLSVRNERSAQSLELQQRADAALTAFAFVHARLPCAARDAEGVEDCGGADDGLLPYRTLGLPALASGTLSYRADRPLTRAPAAFQALVARAVAGKLQAVALPLRSLVPPGYDGMLDFCAALQDAATLGAAAYATGIAATSRTGPGALPGDGTSHAELSGRLGCPSLLSTVGRTHFNAALAAAASYRSVQDLRAQQQATVDFAIWDLAGSGTWMPASAYAVKKAVTNEKFGLAQLFGSLGTDPSVLVKAIVVQAEAAGDAAGMASNILNYAIEVDVMESDLAQLEGIEARMQALNDDVARHALVDAQSAYGFEFQ